MTAQTLIPFVPFLAVFYVVFALAQTLRHKRQGNAASILALLAVVAPLAAYLLTSDATARANLLTGIAINAVLVFVASLVTLVIERRAKTRDANHSFGILGIGLSFLLAVMMFAAPLLPASSANLTTAAAVSLPNTITTETSAIDTTTNTNTANTVLIAAVTPGAVLNDGTFPMMEGTPSAPMNPPPDMPAADASGDETASEEVGAAVAETVDEEPTEVAAEIGGEAAAEVVARPTQIVFPTATPTPDATEAAAEAVAEEEAAASAATICALAVDYNLNLRNLPTTEGSTVLVSIPFGASVLSDGVTGDGWYHVSYDGNSGWISGDYVTAGMGCDALPVTAS